MTLSIAVEELNESVFILHYHKMVRLSIHIAIYFSDHVSLDTFDIERCFVSTRDVRRGNARLTKLTSDS